MSSANALKDWEILVIAVYLLSLVGIGFVARRASRANTLNDYYLAGGTLGFATLFFTLYATQYSGNSLFALPGKAYRDGLAAGALILGIMGIVLVYRLFAPGLHRLARLHAFVSVGDFVMWRYRSAGLRLLVNVILATVLISFILGNFKAIGLLVASTTGGAVSAAWGIAGVAAVMAVYESLGGMRGVIWTDVLQGLILLSTCLIVFLCLALTQDSGVIAQPGQLRQHAAELLADPAAIRSFVSLVVLSAFAAAVYPQAIQRIYAARDVRTLKRSYRLMFFMPLFTVLPIVLIGISAADWFPGLGRADSENAILYAINRLVADIESLAWLRVLFIAAAIAAIMSTVDSALLTLGSTISKDIVLEQSGGRNEAAAHRFSRRLSSVLIAVMATLAIVLPQTIWALLVLKLELLIQIAPLIILGVRCPSLPAQPFLAGALVGSLSVIAMKGASALGLPPLDMPLGIHAGLWALLPNLLLVWVLSRRSGLGQPTGNLN